MSVVIRPITGKRLSDEFHQVFQNILGDQIRNGREPRHAFRWEGTGAERLGLVGTVDRNSIVNLVNGFSGDGRVRLTAEAGSPYRVGGAEVIIRAPLDFDTVWALSPHKVSARLETTHAQTDRAAMSFLNQRIFNPKEQSKTDGPQLVYAVSRANVSDCLNPDLVTRYIVLTHTRDLRGAEHKISCEKLVGHARLLEKVYQGALERSLMSDFGIPVERENGGFRISGVPNKVSQEFSLKEDVTVSHTHNLSDREIVKSWEARSKALGWGPEEAAAFIEYHGDFRDRCRQELKSERDHRSGAVWFGHEKEQSESKDSSQSQSQSH